MQEKVSRGPVRRENELSGNPGTAQFKKDQGKEANGLCLN
jgi:hypothetical protein